MGDRERVSIQLRRPDHLAAYRDLREAGGVGAWRRTRRANPPGDCGRGGAGVPTSRPSAGDKRVAETVDHIAEDHGVDPETVTLACAMKVACGAYNGYQMTDDWFE